MYTVLKGGYNCKHPKDFVMRQPEGIDSYILLIVKSSAHFLIGGNSFILKQPSAVVIPPNTPYEYSGLDDEYKNDYVRFTCSDDSFETLCGFLFEHPILLNNPLHYTQYIQHILWECHYTDPQYRAENISMLFQIMLNKLCQEAESAKHRKNPNVYTSRLQDLRLTMLSQPSRNYSAEELAESMHVSPSYFQHLYKELFEVPFKTDLINMRLDYAQSLISKTDLTLNQIALACGYSNEVHFYRQFKAKTGMTPREYATATQRLVLNGPKTDSKSSFTP